MTNQIVRESGRAALCAARTITLDGKPASVSGIKNDFATVVDRADSAHRAVFSWLAVSRAYINDTDLKSR